MLVHLLKLVWNRKRSNALLMLEIFVSFLVVFGVTAVGLQLLEQYRRPLGFDFRDVWSVEVTRPADRSYDEWSAESAARFERLVRTLESMPPVEAVAAATNRPYSFTTSSTAWTLEGRGVQFETITASDAFRDVLGLELLAGRWFEAGDAALGWDPVVVNPEMARELFGEEDPLGRPTHDASDATDERVVGVVRAYRGHGEFRESGPLFFRRARLEGESKVPLTCILIRVAPGTRAGFEEPLTERLQALAPDWTFTIATLERDREEHLRSTLLPQLLSALVAGFLLLMVVLGLTGVMWQNVTRRTQEIGLRRAVGACKAHIHRQIVGEVMVTASFGVLLGVLVAIQVPVVEPLSFLSIGVVLSATVVSAVFMILLAGVCGFYPGWTATRVEPAAALHYE